MGEFACYAAADAGLEVRIVRPSTIVPAAASGFYNRLDTYSRILEACVIQGSCPSVAPSCCINLIPVDWCSRATVVAAFLDECPLVLNLVNPESTRWSFVFDALSRVVGSVRCASFTDWSRSLIANASDPGHPLHSTLSRFTQVFPYNVDYYDDQGPNGISCSNTLKILSGDKPPVVTVASMQKHFIAIRSNVMNPTTSTNTAATTTTTTATSLTL